MDDLRALREQIRAADRAILLQVQRRLEAARRIGAVKRARGLPLRDYEVEAEVIREARRLCRAMRIEQQVGEEIMQILIRAAVRAQEDRRA